MEHLENVKDNVEKVVITIEKPENSLAALRNKVPHQLSDELKDKYKQRLERSVLRSLGNLLG